MMTERCFECGQGVLEEQTVPFVVERDGARGTIQDRRMHCPSCGQVSYVGDQISEHERAVACETRRMLDLLGPEDLSAIRGKYKLLQREMEQILSVGAKTWVRWERGKVVQSKSVDKLIRTLAEDPALAHRLMREANVDNSEAEAAFQQFHEQTRSRAAQVIQDKLGKIEGADFQAVADDVIRAIHPADKAHAAGQRRMVA